MCVNVCVCVLLGWCGADSLPLEAGRMYLMRSSGPAHSSRRTASLKYVLSFCRRRARALEAAGAGAGGGGRSSAAQHSAPCWSGE